MALIPTYGKPVTLSNVNKTVLLDNFTGSYTVAGTTPPITSSGAVWTGTGVSVSDTVTTLAGLTSSLSWDTGLGSTYVQDVRLDVGWYTPLSFPPDAGAEYRITIGATVTPVGANYIVEILRINVVSASWTNIGSSYRPYLTVYPYFHQIYTTGTFINLTAYRGNESSTPVVLANSLVQLPDDFDINAAYLLTVEIDTVGLRLKINGTLYASLPYVMVRNANDSLSGVSAIDDRRSYPGTGGAVAQGGVDSMRLATLVPPPNPPFWGRFKGTVETP